MCSCVHTLVPACVSMYQGGRQSREGLGASPLTTFHGRARPGEVPCLWQGAIADLGLCNNLSSCAGLSLGWGISQLSDHMEVRAAPTESGAHAQLVIHH